MVKLLKKIMILICFLSLVKTATATEYKFFILAGVGTTTDNIAKKLQEIYEKDTGNKLIITTILGGNGVPAVNAFKAEKTPSVILTTGNTNLFNYATMENLPYNDNDFRHLMLIGDLPSYYITRAETEIKTANDIAWRLSTMDKPLIGQSNGTQGLININAIDAVQPTFAFQKKTKKITAVNYKTPAEVLIGLQRGDVDVAFVSLTESSVFTPFIREGKLRVVATTHKNDHDILGFKATSLPRATGIKQFDGQFFISMSPSSNAETDKLAKDITKAARSNEWKDVLQKNNIIVRNYELSSTKDLVSSMRAEIIARKSSFTSKENQGVTAKE